MSSRGNGRAVERTFPSLTAPHSPAPRLRGRPGSIGNDDRWAMVSVMVRRLSRGRRSTRPGCRPLARHRHGARYCASVMGEAAGPSGAWKHCFGSRPRCRDGTGRSRASQLRSLTSSLTTATACRRAMLSFEQLHGVVLPATDRSFLSDVANGGRGRSVACLDSWKKSVKTSPSPTRVRSASA
jgi:hypothetical protein